MWAGAVVVGALAAAGVTATEQAVPPGVLVGSVAVAMVTCVPMARWLRPRVEAVLWTSHPDDAPALLSGIGRRLTEPAPAAGDEHLGVDLEAEIAAQLATRLRLPYVAVIDPGQPPADGVDPSRLARVPLVFAGEQLGELIASPRPRDRTLPAADLGLLESLASQIAITLHAVRARNAVAQSRAEVIDAREEERRRLRRDLHDGLGPTLASLGLHLAALEQLIGTQPERAVDVVQELRGEVRSTSAVVRELVYGLGPELLDSVGLADAIRSRAADLAAHGGPAIEVDVEAAVSTLPAAVEIALYRIAGEALANVHRHAFATHACLRLQPAGTDQVRLLIEDDGRGWPAGLLPGVGLTAMRERAEELRGTLVIRDAPGSGATVEVLLPLRRGT